jgi:TPR repeat protein
MYQFGMAVPQNREIAIRWFTKAAGLGHPKGSYWAQWLNDYTNCIGFRNAEEQHAVGFVRCPADPVGVTFRSSGDRVKYLRRKAKEFDKKDAEIARRHAERAEATSETACAMAGGTWTPDAQSAFGGGCK